MPCKYRGDSINPLTKVACVEREGITIFRPSYKCSIHKRCIDNYGPKGDILEKWNAREESEMFVLCRLCSEHCPVSQNDNSER